MDAAPESAPTPAPTPAPLSPARERARRNRRWRAALASGLQMGVLLVGAWGLLFHFSVVRGTSMAPGIADGDRIVVDHLAYLMGDVQRGDVVVLEYPLDTRVDYIKRVIGLPGDEILIEDGYVLVNGEPLREPYVAGPDHRPGLRLTVSPGTYFVLGDNRPHSADSREFGLVPADNLIGKVDLRIWPPERVGLIH